MIKLNNFLKEEIPNENDDGDNLRKKLSNKLEIKFENKKWTEFTNETTFHGIKNIFDPNHSLKRKLFWTIVVAGILCLFLFQVIARGIDFGRKESSVNFEVLYSKKLDFPSVTICNQNRYRYRILSSFSFSLFIRFLSFSHF